MADYFRLFYLDRIYGPSYVITEVLSVIAVAVLLTKFKKTRKCWIRFAISVPITFCFYVLAASVTYYFGGSNIQIMWIVYPLTIILYAVFASKYGVRTRIVISVLYFSNYIEIMSVSESASSLLDGVYRMFDALNTPYAVIIFCTLTAFLVVYYKFFTLDKFKFVPVMCISIAVVSGVVAIVVESFSSFGWLEVTRGYHIVVSGAFYSISVIVYYLINHICREVEENNEMLMMQKNREEDEKYYELAARNLEELKKIRHDIKNQYGYIKVLLEQKEYDKALDYFSSLELRAMPALNTVSSENTAINNIMNLERRKAADKGIDMDVRYAVPTQVNIDKVDLTSLISNLVDNALEYVALHITEKSTISVEICQKSQYLFINVTNPVLPEADPAAILQLKTRKHNPELHGYGTKIIDDIVKKYNGCCVYNVENGMFKANAMLALSN